MSRILFATVVFLIAVFRSPGGSLSNLGPQVFTASTHAACFGLEGDADRIYLVRDGALDGGVTPGALIVLDPNSAEILRTLPLPGSEGSWGVTMAGDQTVYVGVYATGHLFRHVPGENKVSDLGRVPGQTFLYYLSAGENGAIHGGTFLGAAIFKYAPKGGFELWSADLNHTGANYVRGTAFDAVNHAVYGGLATPARLIRRDLATGESRDITTPAFAREAFILGIRVVGSKLFCRLADRAQCVVLDVSPDGKTVREDAIFPMMSIGVSPADEKECVYYTDRGEIHRYDPATRMTQFTGQRWPSNGYEFGLLHLRDQANFPGLTLLALGNSNGQIWLGKHNLGNERTTVEFLPIPGIRQTIESIICGPDGKIYSSGYLTGGTGVYDPAKPVQAHETLRGLPQCEGIATLGEKIYYGGYPGAVFYEHDPRQPWREGNNPKLLFNLANHEQDRPFGMSSGGGLVILGTAPNYGHLGGMLCLLDPATGKRTIRTRVELRISNLSLIATCYHDGMIYGGTSISGGIGAVPTQERALLLRYDVAHDKGTGIPLPAEIPNQKAITTVCAGPDGNIWMMCEGWLLIYNPASGTFVHQANLFPEVIYQPTSSRVVLRDAKLLAARDGRVYGTIRDRHLFRINPEDYHKEVLLTHAGGCAGLVQHPGGDFYFFANTDLMKYSP